MGQVNQFQQCHIGGKAPFGFCYFSDLPVKTFNRVGGVDQLTDNLVVPEIRG